MASRPPFPAPLTGSLQLYQKKPIALPYFDSEPDLPHSLVFIPGLTDTIGTIPYLPELATTIRKHGFSLVQPQMTCNLGGYGLCSLEGDAQEMAACVSHLRSTSSKRSGKVVLMGHSTGCQDIVAYLLSAQRAASALTKIDAAVLQAPVSDREFFELTRSSAEEQVRADMDRELQHATQLHLSGKDAQLVPRKQTEGIALPTTPEDKPDEEGQPKAGNASAVLAPAMTAYRTWSLNAREGHDDFFSSDLDDQQITDTHPGARTVGRAIRNLAHGSPNTARLLALIGEKDEYLPDGAADVLLSRWTQLLHPTGTFQAMIVPDANHQASTPTATTHLLTTLDDLLQSLA
ncbi:predicted hydrolases or acyltransferases [Moesziomyces antarcticus T-34]|uniref:Predicted hydrolases or acyltransferases n=1 Tax=Pseudozyma antarctica (strain T-34) TaxID=1151754 RepID=M9MCC1_PSEA3|nr:predicted hydrolases or acyltransferases [Moesziomyces antarcticus T-34]